jgi:hypothetical protein
VVVVTIRETSDPLSFSRVGQRRVEADFDAGRTTSDGGVLALSELAARTGLLVSFAACFIDHRRKDLIEHSVLDLVSQRVLALACGYEDLNDHDAIRDDPALATAVGKSDPTGAKRKRERDRGHGLASSSTLNRLELTPQAAGADARYKKILCDHDAVDRFLVEAFLDAHKVAPRKIVLDLDATDDPLHGNQEGRFFHGYYHCYCYLPLYIFCGDHLLCSRLRPSNIDGAHGALQEVHRIVEQIRGRWPKVKIILRGDSGFARDALMTWCEQSGVHFVFGLAKNERLKAAIQDELADVAAIYEKTGAPARRFKDFSYRTLKSWTRRRRVIAKAEYIVGKANPRFIVTSLSSGKAKALYEKLYCARGDMENRIKEQQLDLFADRTSTATMRANQTRLYFSSVAYVLVSAFRRVALRNTELARAQCGTIRNRLLKIGGRVRISARRVYLSLSSSFPLKSVLRAAVQAIDQAYPATA